MSKSSIPPDDLHTRTTIRPSTFSGRIEQSVDGTYSIVLDQDEDDEPTEPENRTLALTQKLLLVFDHLSFSEKEMLLEFLVAWDRVSLEEKKIILGAAEKLAGI